MRKRDATVRGGEARRGNTTLITLVSLGLLLLLLGVVLDVGRMSVARKELQSLADAASLAGAGGLLDAGALAPGPAAANSHGGWLIAPADLAGARALAMAEAALAEGVVSDLSTPPLGTVRLGIYDPASGEFVEADPPTAVEVRLGYSQARGNPLPLAVWRWLGIGPFDVEVRSVATLDGRLVGFQPLGGQSAPVMPLVLSLDDASGEGSGWESQATADTSPAFNDRWTLDADGLAAGGDGIPELVFRLRAERFGGPGATAWRARIGTAGGSAWERQALEGLSSSDLAQHGGRLALGPDGRAWLDACDDSDLSSRELAGVLGALAGAPRVWPLGKKDGAGKLVVTGFTAGQVVECWDGGEEGIVLLIQPCLLSTTSAVVDAEAPENPWIAKVSVAR